jgi:hypothetical protein
VSDRQVTLIGDAFAFDQSKSSQRSYGFVETISAERRLGADAVWIPLRSGIPPSPGNGPPVRVGRRPVPIPPRGGITHRLGRLGGHHPSHPDQQAEHEHDDDAGGPVMGAKPAGAQRERPAGG